MKLFIKFILPAAHFLAVSWLGLLIYESQDPSKYMGWILIFLLDFPVSLLLIPIQYLVGFIEISIPKVELVNYWAPLLHFGILGTLWWYFFPLLIYRNIKNIDKKNT